MKCICLLLISQQRSKGNLSTPVWSLKPGAPFSRGRWEGLRGERRVCKAQARHGTAPCDSSVPPLLLLNCFYSISLSGAALVDFIFYFFKKKKKKKAAGLGKISLKTNIYCSVDECEAKMPEQSRGTKSFLSLIDSPPVV